MPRFYVLKGAQNKHEWTKLIYIYIYIYIYNKTVINILTPRFYENTYIMINIGFPKPSMPCNVSNHNSYIIIASECPI